MLGRRQHFADAEDRHGQHQKFDTVEHPQLAEDEARVAHLRIGANSGQAKAENAHHQTLDQRAADQRQ